MFKLYKSRGISLIELMVAVGLGLILVLSMLAYYSISQRNAIDYQIANQEQQKIRNMLNMLARDLENTGGFECAEHDRIFENPNNGLRFPRDIISLGENLQNRQIMFVHPVLEEYRFKATGLFVISNSSFEDYIPRRVDVGCGRDAHSPMLIGTTLLEVIPITEMAPSAENITAFVSLSSVQAKRSEDTDLISGPHYDPQMRDASVLFFSNNSDNEQQRLDLPFGRNTVDIFLGFSPSGPGRLTHVPEQTMTSLDDGGWINPFSTRGNYDLLVDRDATKTPNPTILNTKLGSTSGAMYPLRTNAIEQIRAIKFQFTFNAGDRDRQQIITRVIRFKNTHLMKINQSN